AEAGREVGPQRVLQLAAKLQLVLVDVDLQRIIRIRRGALGVIEHAVHRPGQIARAEGQRTDVLPEVQRVLKQQGVHAARAVGGREALHAVALTEERLLEAPSGRAVQYVHT